MGLKLNLSRLSAGLKKLKPRSSATSTASSVTSSSPLKEGLARLSAESYSPLKNGLKADTVQLNKKASGSQTQSLKGSAIPHMGDTTLKSQTSTPPRTPSIQDKAAPLEAKVSGKPAESAKSSHSSASYQSAKSRLNQGTQTRYNAEKPLTRAQQLALLIVEPKGKMATLTEANVRGVAARPFSLKEKMAQYLNHPQGNFIPAQRGYTPEKPEGVGWVTSGYAPLEVPFRPR
jgi:hypothetical protein